MTSSPRSRGSASSFFLPFFQRNLPDVTFQQRRFAFSTVSTLEYDRLAARGDSIKSAVNHFITHLENSRGITREGNFSTAFPGSAAILPRTSLAAGILRLRYSKKLLHRIDASIPAEPGMSSSQWHAICVPSVFQPSDYTSEYVKKVERSFAGHRVLGLVLRFGAKAADWVDDGMFSMAWRSTRKHFRALHEQIVANKADRVFVATDAELAEKILGKRLGKRMIAVTQLKRTRGEHTEEAVLRRVVELEMLGKCVALLLTPQDEFGRVAIAMNGGKAPVSFLTM